MNDLRLYDKEVKENFRNQIFVGKSSSYKKAWLEIMRDYPLAVAKVRTRSEGAKLYAVEIMRKAMRYDVSEAVLFIALKLARFHTFEGQWKQVSKYQKIVSKYQKIVDAEIKVESYLIDINKDILSKIKSGKLLEKFNVIIEDLAKYSKEVDSYSFLLLSYELKLRKYQLEENHDLILETCQEALEAITSKRFTAPEVVWFMFTYPTVPILIQRGELESAKSAIDNCYKYSRKKTNNWYVAHSYDVILNFHKGEFDQVKFLLNKAKAYPTEMVKERYKFYEAYSALMGEDKFRVGKFINEVHEFSKDKQGYNIAVIIVQLLHLVKNKSYDEYIDRLFATNQYIKRAINSNGVLRSKYFLRILLLLPQSNFHPVLFEAKSKEYFKKLKSLPISNSSPSVEIELIQYEVLYKRVLYFLK